MSVTVNVYDIRDNETCCTADEILMRWNGQQHKELLRGSDLTGKLIMLSSRI